MVFAISMSHFKSYFDDPSSLCCVLQYEGGLKSSWPNNEKLNL